PAGQGHVADRLGKRARHYVSTNTKIRERHEPRRQRPPFRNQRDPRRFGSYAVRGRQVDLGERRRFFAVQSVGRSAVAAPGAGVLGDFGTAHPALAGRSRRIDEVAKKLVRGATPSSPTSLSVRGCRLYRLDRRV